MSTLNTLKEKVLSVVPASLKKSIEEKFELLKNQEINILVLGPTGVGKSSTINAIFNTKKTVVGYGVAPETKDFECYKLDNLVIWDTPGFGDGVKQDEQYAKLVKEKLNELKDGLPLIDVVLVIVDGSNRDMGTTYKIINDYVLKVIRYEQRDRVIVAINQADVAMKGIGWNYKTNLPEPVLEKFLEDKVRSIHDRVKESTGVDIEPMYYCAGGMDRNGKQMRSYNIDKLLCFIINNTPLKKRIIYTDTINKAKVKGSSSSKKGGFLNDIKDAISDGIGAICDGIGSVCSKIGSFVSSCFSWW